MSDNRKQANAMLKGLREMCKVLGVNYQRDYVERRTEGAYTIKLYGMASPNEMGCAALVAKAQLLGATKCGFKPVGCRPGPHTGVWSFVAHVPPLAAPVQRELPFAARWPGPNNLLH